MLFHLKILALNKLYIFEGFTVLSQNYNVYCTNEFE